MSSRPVLSQSVLHVQCQSYLRRALEGLGTPTNEIYQINLAPLIFQPMSGDRRFFHNFDHVLKVGGHSDPIEMLAGAFHDIVYVQVDIGIPFNLTSFMNRVVQEIDGVMKVRSQLPPNPEIHWLLALFEFEPGQPLEQGQNEFLSALVAVQVLAPLVSMQDRLAIAVCIEATIPFRMTEGSHGLPEVTLTRLRRINQQYNFRLSDTDLVTMVRRSIRVANRDVASFAQTTAAGFLADTWNLLPEKNVQFSPRGLYRVQDYRKAIENTETFFRRVNARSIFRQFRDEPSREAHEQRQQQAAQNLAVGRLYLSCKLVAIALLEALCEPLGKETTMELPMGTLPNPEGGPVFRLEEFLPPPPEADPGFSEIEREVWQLVCEGRAASSYEGDLVNSPLTTFLIQYHGFERIPQQRRMAKAWLEGSLCSRAFLQGFDAQFVDLLLEAIQRLWEHRQQAFRHHFFVQSDMPTQSAGSEVLRHSSIQP